MRASEIAELLPRDKRSVVKGTPNFYANSLTFSWEAFSSAVSVDYAAAGAGAGVTAGVEDLILCLAKTAAVTEAASFGAVKSDDPIDAIKSVEEPPCASFYYRLAWMLDSIS